MSCGTSSSTPASIIRPGIDLLFRVIPVDNILFGSEMFGAVRGIDPETGHAFDDTKRYIDALGSLARGQNKVFELNARRVYPRLDVRLKARGTRLGERLQADDCRAMSRHGDVDAGGHGHAA